MATNGVLSGGDGGEARLERVLVMDAAAAALVGRASYAIKHPHGHADFPGLEAALTSIRDQRAVRESPNEIRR
jgi:hypothetical protein